MKKILMTNAYIKDYTGSEVDTVSIANYFVENGYCVDIFTLDKGYPLLKSVDHRVRVIDYLENDELNDRYDYIWAHHYPLLDFLLFDKKIKAKYIHYLSLSSYANYEAYPDYYQSLSLVSTLSYEAKEQNRIEGYDNKYFNIFPNYIMEKELKVLHNAKNKIESICVVSNHVPNEVERIKAIFEKKGISVDIYGKKHIYKLVSADLLLQYDVIISIGKTINLGIALGIPCYVYDHFGGDGYITKKNINNSFKFNFSGRYSRCKYSDIELVENIIQGYGECLKDIEECQKFAKEHFLFETIINKAFENMHKQPMDYEKLYQNYNLLFRKSPLFVRENGIRQNLINKGKLFLQIYYAKDGNYSEKESIKVEIIDKTVKFNSKKFSRSLNFRIDLVNRAGYKIDNLIINGESNSIDKLTTSGLLTVSKSLISMNDDPWVEIKNLNYLELSFNISDYNDEIRNSYYSANYLKVNDLVHAEKYVKGFFKPKLVIIISDKIQPDMFIIKNDKAEVLQAFCNYNFKTNQTIIEIPINSNCIRCFSKVDMNEEKLIFEYNWSRLKKIRRRLFST